MLNGANNGEGWSKDFPLRYVYEVIQKLEDGTYPTEPTRCFCGSDKDTVIAERDRYTIPHRMVLCENCLIMRANPRMTKQAYKQFYNEEYRKIYDGFPYQERWNDFEFLFQQQVSKAHDLKDFLAKVDITYKSVIDIGSDKGGTLLPFKEAGATVYGTEWCDEGRQYAESKGIPCVPDIEDLIAQGVKADLIIMTDVIEHLMDLREMETIHKLLNEDGTLFVYTPGFLAAPASRHFQNAHTFQFIGASLEYAMTNMGYYAEFIDDRIVSVWKRSDFLLPDEPPTEWRKYITDHLENRVRRALPPVRTRCKFSNKEMLSNLESNVKHRVPSVSELKDKYSGPVVVIGGGPSVDGQTAKIRELVGRGYPLVVIERMYPWAMQHGLTPDFVVALDASDGVEDGFTHLCATAKHLLVATINPIVFDCLKNHEVYIFSGAGAASGDAQEIWHKSGHSRVLVVNTGSTVVLTSVFLSLVMGFRNVHLFGFDCMTLDARSDYAAGIAGKSVDRTYFAVEIGEDPTPVLTCPSFLAFAQQFFNMIETARKWGMIESIDVYGESLINLMWEEQQRQEMSQWQTSQPEIRLSLIQ